MKRFPFFVIVLFLLGPLLAIAQNKPEFTQFFEIENSHSYIEFSVKYMGYAKMKGRFAEFSGLLRYDKNNISSTSVSLYIKPESLDTDLDFRDNDLKSENWLDVKKFPAITFVSKSAISTLTGFDLSGDLTIKSITKSVTLHMAPSSGILKDIRDDLQVIFTGTTSIDRTQFGVEGKNWSGVKEGITAVGTEVTIEVSILGKQYQVTNYVNRFKNPQNNPGKLYKIITEQGIQAGLDEFKRMLANNEVKAPAMDIVGHMLRLGGKNAEALQVYEANKNAFPESSDVYYALGEIYFIQGDRQKAKMNFEESLKRDPTNIRASEYVRSLGQ